MTSQGDDRLTLVIPARNSASHLRPTLTSLEPLALGGAEVILVDDGSTDDTGRTYSVWSNSFPSARLISQPPLGLAAARNTGLLEARREYVQFLDSDDIANPVGSRLLLIMALRSKSAIVRGAEARHRFGTSAGFSGQSSEVHEVDAATELLAGFGGTLRFLYRRTFLIESGLVYPEHLAYAEDLPFALAVANAVPTFLDSQVPLYSYAMGRQGQLTSVSRRDSWDRLQPSLEYCTKIARGMRKDVREVAAALVTWYVLSSLRHSNGSHESTRASRLVLATRVARELRVSPERLIRRLTQISRRRISH
jgi:glycosyltransferase involved in cell wall biosynthesis